MLCFLILENVHYTEAYETVNVTDDTPEGREQAERKSRFSALREAAEKKMISYMELPT